MTRSGKTLAVAWLGVGLAWIGVAACSWGEEPSHKPAAATAPVNEEKPEPNVAKGRVTNSAGEPIAGATINLKNTLFYGSSAQVKTGKDGTYRVELARGVWHVTAQVEKVFNKKKLRFDLCPEVADDFANTDGGVRNFSWKLTGEKEDGLGTYGSPVIVYQQPGDYSFQLNDVELTLTPDGPLVDGSKGQPITGKPESTGDGLAVKDVPLGRYKITARLAEEGKAAQPLKVRVRNKASFVEALTADFEAPYPNLPIQRIEVELKKP